MNNLLIPLGIMVVLAILGWLTQQLKNASEQQQNERERKKRAGVKTDTSSIDRFLEEIDRLRQKNGSDTAPAPKPVPKPIPKPVATVRPVKKVVAPSPPPPPPPVVTPQPRRSRPVEATPIDDLPVAAVVAPTPTAKKSAPKAANPRQLPKVSVPQSATKQPKLVKAPGAEGPGPSPVGKKMLDMLSQPESIKLAFMMNEILGPPKSRRRN